MCSDMPDLADNSSLPIVLIHPAEDSLIKHQLPNGSMTAWLQDGGQAVGYQPLPICCAHQRHQWLPEQPADNPHSLLGVCMRRLYNHRSYSKSQQVRMLDNVQPVSTILEPGLCIVADCFFQAVQWLANCIIVILTYIDMHLSRVASIARSQQNPDCSCESVNACQSWLQGA